MAIKFQNLSYFLYGWPRFMWLQLKCLSSSKAVYLDKFCVITNVKKMQMVCRNVWFQKISIPPPTEDHWKFRGGGGVQRQ